MTRTTNFEISKKLKEIGFKADCSYFYFHSDNNDCEANSLEKYGFDKISECDIEDKYYPAYELETLLEFAFNNIENFCICDRGVSVAEFLSDYDNWHGHYKIVDNLDISIGFKETKISYANAIGQLIILLHEKKLIKF